MEGEGLVHSFLRTQDEWGPFPSRLLLVATLHASDWLNFWSGEDLRFDFGNSGIMVATERGGEGAGFDASRPVLFQCFFFFL